MADARARALSRHHSNSDVFPLAPAPRTSLASCPEEPFHRRIGRENRFPRRSKVCRSSGTLQNPSLPQLCRKLAIPRRPRSRVHSAHRCLCHWCHLPLLLCCQATGVVRSKARKGEVRHAPASCRGLTACWQMRFEQCHVSSALIRVSFIYAPTRLCLRKASAESGARATCPSRDCFFRNPIPRSLAARLSWKTH